MSGTHQRISQETMNKVNKHRMKGESFDAFMQRVFGIRRTPKPFFYRKKK